MNVQTEIINLLYWAKDAGVTPRRESRSDRMLCPITKKIALRRQLRPNQQSYNLWIPTVSGIRHLVKLKKEVTNGLIIVTDPNGRVGAGCGESEAVLSLLQNMRAAA